MFSRTTSVLASVLAVGLIALTAGSASASTDAPDPSETPICTTISADATDEPTTDVTDEPTTDVTDEPTTDIVDEQVADVTDDPTTDVTEDPTPDVTEVPTGEPTVVCVLAEKLEAAPAANGLVEVNDDGLLPDTGARPETALAALGLIAIGAGFAMAGRRRERTH